MRPPAVKTQKLLYVRAIEAENRALRESLRGCVGIIDDHVNPAKIAKGDAKLIEEARKRL